ncbi:endoplasmic reticulum membrane-associated RNA degradation protein-like isoform X2 [Frankliniella occidentalis]|uniref:Endoplasmic reticulum membrane-associated RNA degradation protein-like isoform X2 n=1 Tax=Frankliniella occidentalis TaxID=133901 RepID=A0A6J1SA91_FRAOC|nr:endoplasmic reticulum membrane-associated RNA degradation protein-like isoform X2 [Frankliniella occidentalis]
MFYEAQFSKANSFLSPSIKFILVDAREDLTYSEANNFVTPCLTFNWDYILLYSGLSADMDFHEHNHSIWKKFWSIFIDSGRKLQECRSPPIHFWQWTNCVEEIQSCYIQLQSDKSLIIPLKSALFLTSIFENAVFQQCTNSNVPFLLKDLLKSVELLSVFGKFPMFMAKALLGTPLAFNIRNVCWHGFPAPEEVHFDISAALVVLITSIGEILCDSNKITTFSLRPRMDAVTWATFLPLLTSTGFPNLLEHIDDVREVIQKSHFIPKTHLLYWINAFDLLCNGKHGECLMLLLPALEHTLRCVFCSVNCCLNRVLVAEQHSLYTTMDEILDQHFVKSEGLREENQLILLLGQNILEMLMDILHSFGGPRIRDKLSHGECCISQIPSVVCNHVFCVALTVLLKLGPPQNIDLEKLLTDVEENFTPKFHSVSLLKSQTATVLEKVKALNLDLRLFGGTRSTLTDSVLKLKLALLNHSISQVSCPGDIVDHIDLLLNKPVRTLYRTKTDMSMIGSLRKIISAVEKTCDNCSNTLKSSQQYLSQHMLRSRQRATFSRFLEFVPSLQIIFNSILLMVMFQLHTSPEIFAHPKLMKYLQQYSENIASLSNQGKNRWVEIEEKTGKFCQYCISVLNSTHKMCETCD